MDLKNEAEDEYMTLSESPAVLKKFRKTPLEVPTNFQYSES